MTQDHSLPALRESYYVLENITHTAYEPQLYADAYAKGKHYLDFCKDNWDHPTIVEHAFRQIHDASSLAMRVRQIQQDEGSFGRDHIKVRNYDVYTVPVKPYRLFALENVEEAVERALSVNPEVADHIRRDLSERFIGRSYYSGGANNVGNELSLAELAALTSEATAEAVAGPEWKKIADARYMKMKESDIPAIRKIIEEGLPREKFADAVRWSEMQRYSTVHGMVMNHWAAFADDYQGFVFNDLEGKPWRYLVTDTYLPEREPRGNLRDLEKEWTEKGVLDALIRMENMADFGGRFAETFMRLRTQQDEMLAMQDASRLWITPGGWREDAPPLPYNRPAGFIPR